VPKGISRKLKRSCLLIAKSIESSYRKDVMRILLVYPPTRFSSYNSIGLKKPPLGLAYLAAVIRDEHEVKIIDFDIEKADWRHFPYQTFDVVGISAETAKYPASLRIAAVAKDRGAIVVMGGPHVSFLDGDALKSGVVDFVVRNEREHSFASLLKSLRGEISLETVRGLSYLKNGELTRTEDSPFIEDLDSLPFPARDLLPLHLYGSRIEGRPTTTMMTSRGCPFTCNFCSSSRLFGHRWRARSVESIFEEMEMLHRKYGFSALSIMDDTFTVGVDRAVKLSEKLQTKGWDLVWSVLSHVSVVVRNPDMFRKMARAGLRSVFVGFESGSQEVLEGYRKKGTVKESYEAMRILKENALKVTGSFIIGALNETREMIKETIAFAKRLNPDSAQFTILTPYPGTKLYEQVTDRIFCTDWEAYTCLHPVLNLDYLSPRELKSLLAEAYLSFYGRPGKFIGNLRYLSTALSNSFRSLLKWPDPTAEIHRGGPRNSR
jgi:anaerobic magnesium-protoporphyrin IX monomethyl ester cyclase